MGAKKLTAPILAVRKRTRPLDLWRLGIATADIAHDVGYASPAWVRTIVAQARKRGDPRAVARASGRPRHCKDRSC